MAENRVQITITGRDQASSVFKKVGGSAADLGKALMVGVAGAGAAVAAGLGVAAKSAADFERVMDGVRAVSGASASEMDQLSSLALQLGKDTAFSASEAAKGLEELVKGGVTIPEIMNGAAQATLNLAAAGGTDLASAAEIAANALNTFNLSGSDMAKVSDLIAGAANASAIDVNDFKLSLAAAGAVTATVGGSFDDLSVAIAAMGNAGIKGSDAGTSLKTMLLNLQPATEDQADVMRELGLLTASGANAFFDATGKVKSFSEIAGTLQTALGGLTDQQKLANLEILFGSDAIRAAAVFSDLGAQGFDTLAASMSKVTAEAVAAQRLDNLAGDLEQLKGAAETAAIVLGLQLQGGLREVTQAATEFINKSVLPFIEEHGPKLVESFSSAARSALNFAGSIKDQLVDAFRTALPRIQEFISGVLTFAQEHGPRFVDAVKNAANEAVALAGKIRDQASQSLAEMKERVVEARIAIVDWAAEAGPAGDAVELALEAAYDAADALQLLLAGEFSAAAKKASESLNDLRLSADSLRSAFDVLRGQAEDTLRRVGDTAEVQRLNVSFEDLKTAGQGLWAALGELERATSSLMAAVNEITAALGLNRKAEDDAALGAAAFRVAADILNEMIKMVTSSVASATAMVREIAASFDAAAATARNLVGAARDLRGALEAIPRNVSTTITTIRESVERIVGARQHGGPVMGGSPYLVGEAGPEIFVPRRSGHVVPNHELGNSGGRGVPAANVTVHVHGSVLTERDLIDAIHSGLLVKARANAGLGF